MTEMLTWEEFMRPTLAVLSDGKVRSRRELASDVASFLSFTSEQIEAKTASGQPLHENRIGWGLSFLTNVGAINRPSRGNYAISESGRMLLTKFPDGFKERDIKALGDDPNSPIREYVPTITRTTSINETEVEQTSLTPEEQLRSGIARIHQQVSTELLVRLQDKNPEFFEHAVVDLLVAMGYGGTGGAGSVTKKSNDGGIDGVIDQDVLGLNKVYIQAKRYADNNPVGRPDLQAFVGALSGKADGGVFITTSRFSEGAKTYAETVPTRIILIDGQRLTELMIRYKVGVQAVGDTYQAVEIDEDFFA